ncbi:hypothetical protein CULC0102_2091 [Corynebacterium ulcerans 0102]|nr:hypothetical protein AFK72_09950 [Corynebacterium ulcerans]OIS05631.1 hypothetical protein BHG00_08130 [Corynebacterium ulcerans]BAM28289.1 hypothetical protein CULC0102_2091 [Corynebacterium ulcerans 0102]
MTTFYFFIFGLLWGKSGMFFPIGRDVKQKTYASVYFIFRINTGRGVMKKIGGRNHVIFRTMRKRQT